MRDRATTPRSRARDLRFAIPKPHPRHRARASRHRATSRAALARIDAMREFPTHPHRARSRRDCTRGVRDAARASRRRVIVTPRPIASHRIASHRIAHARTLSARRTAAAGFTTLAEDFFAVVARARATVGRVVEAVTANMMGVVLYRCGARARRSVAHGRRVFMPYSS
jgi:hypothetical protein